MALYIKHDADGKPELHGETDSDVLKAFAALGNGVKSSSETSLKPVTKSEKEVNLPDVDKVAARARFNPAPGTSFADRAERALQQIGRAATLKQILSAMLQDPTFTPEGKTPNATLRYTLNKYEGKFARVGDGTWILKSLAAEQPILGTMADSHAELRVAA